MRRRLHDSSPHKQATQKLRAVAPRPQAGGAQKPIVPQKDALRWVPLGGLEEIGRNMMFFEYDEEIVILDMGFQFPEEETPGIDYIIPNISYLESKKKNIKAIILTHGHLDHIGAVPYLIDKLGNPPIYTAALTRGMVEKKCAEFTHLPKLQIQIVKNWDKIAISKNLTLEFFAMAHTIPDTIGVIFHTPVGRMVHFADFRVDYDLEGNAHGLEDIKKVGAMGIHTLLIDSTNAIKSGKSLSEKIVEKNIEALLRGAEGRIIVTLFSSMVSRMGEIIKIAEKMNKKVALNGRSLIDAMRLSKDLGYFKVSMDTMISVEELSKYRDDQVIILTTGGQGEPNAGLMKMANGEHKWVQIKEGDTMIFSSSVIPGNERSVQNLTDSLARQGAIVFNSKMVDIHASGHAPEEDLKLVIGLVKPQHVIPVHGYYFMRSLNARFAKAVGVKSTLLVDNGDVVEITPEGLRVSGEKIPAFYVMVDGLGVGDVGEVVLRDRLMLSEEGMIVIITTMSRKTGRTLKNPDIISRGFIYLKDNVEMLNEIRHRIRGILTKIPPSPNVDPDYIKTLIRDQVGQLLFKKTGRRPMILPVIIEI